MVGYGLAVVLGVAFVFASYRLRAAKKELQRTKQLFEVSLHINSALVKEDLLKIIMSTTANIVKAEASSVILVDPRTGDLFFDIATGEKSEQVKQIRLKMGEGIAGWVADQGVPLKIDDVSQDSRWSSKVATTVQYRTRNLLCVPIASRGEIIGVLQVINKHGKKAFTNADLELLQAIASPIAIALENASLYEALEYSLQTLKETTAAKERMESELFIAKNIQMSFLPDDIPVNKRFELASLMKPAREVGGDFYDYYSLDERFLFFVLGDVSDKGIPAALFMAVTMTLFKAARKEGSTPAQILSKVNDELYSDDSTMFATVFCGILDTLTGELVYCNGGHCTPFLINAQSEVSRLSVKSGLPLAVMAESRYVDEHILLAPGDAIILYTDGITEAEKENGEQFGMARVEQTLRSHAEQSVEHTVNGIVDAVFDFVQDVPQSDDIALLMVKRRSA